MRMPEPEVSLRLAIHLIATGRAKSEVAVSIDGAHVKMGNKVHFELPQFLASLGWRAEGSEPRWQVVYRNEQHKAAIRVHSQSGQGDVVAKLEEGPIFFAEAKGGPLERSKSSDEYPILREALGQLLTLESLSDGPALAVAVPHSPKFSALAIRWRSAPLIVRTGIRILTVAPSGEVFGW
jgi:hypothetical protein